MGKTESIENVTKLKNMNAFLFGLLFWSFILVFLVGCLFLSCNNGGVTAYGDGTQTGIVTSVTESSIVEEIKKMTESGTVKASGLFDSKLIEDVRKAIVYLADERPNVLVTLDLSAVKGLSEFLFAYCKNLAEIVLPDSVTSIGGRAFEGCSRLTSVTIPGSVTSIGDWAFVGCSRLTSVTIPDSVTSIGYNAFNGCTGLTSVTILGSVTSIGGRAFYGCSRLTNVTIPGSVTSIGDWAFEGCTELTSCNYTGTLAQWCNISFGNIYANPCSHAKKFCIQGQEIKDLVIPDGVTSIGDRAFYGCTGLTSVTIPSSVTSIGYYAFYGCTGLTSVTIPRGVTRIETSTFEGCTGLTSVRIPRGVTRIGLHAFNKCENLANAIFSGTSGWYYSSSSGLTGGTAINSERLANSKIAAAYLSYTYSRYYWYKN